MSLWKVRYVYPETLNVVNAIYVQAFSEQEAKELAFKHITQKEYSTEQRELLFIAIEVYGNY